LGGEKEMSVGIRLQGARNVLLDNVFVTGFDKGLELVESDAILDEVIVRKCNVGLNVERSNVLVQNSTIIENVIDLIVNRSTVFLMNVIAHRILEVLPWGDYRVNPYRAGVIAKRVINTRDVERKKHWFKRLINILEAMGYGWLIYEILKELRGLL